MFACWSLGKQGWKPVVPSCIQSMPKGERGSMVETFEVGDLMMPAGLLGSSEDAKMVGAADAVRMRTSITEANIAGMAEHFILRDRELVSLKWVKPVSVSMMPSRVIHSRERSFLLGDAIQWERHPRTRSKRYTLEFGIWTDPFLS